MDTKQQHTADLMSPCEPWTGYLDEDGYGRVQADGKWKMAHRVAYEQEVGAIPQSKVVDHLCRNRACVNVDHMEIVTVMENVLRGTGVTAQNAMKLFCKSGHPLSGENLLIDGRGRRACKECGRARWRAYRQRKINNGTWERT